jgi:hypothetical protein
VLLCAAWAGLLCAAVPFVFRWYVGAQGRDVRTLALVSFVSGGVGIMAGFMGLSGVKANGSLLTLPPVMVGFAINGFWLVGASASLVFLMR